MSVEKITRIFERNFKKTLTYLFASFAFVTFILLCTFLYFGTIEAINQAESSIKTYRSNLVSIFILNEQSALDVAIIALNEGNSLVRFERDNGQNLGLLDFRAKIETSGKEHGSLVYSIMPVQAVNTWIFGTTIFFWLTSIFAVVLAFRRAQRELIETVSVPLELLSERIRSSNALGKKSGLHSEFQALVNPGTQEIAELENALMRFSCEISAAHEAAILAKQDKAIAQMTQMLAHDIRKPFSMFKATLETITAARSASELKMITQDFIPEINRAMSSVNGLLQDVMEVSSKAVPCFEQVRPESLIETTLVDLFSMQEGIDITIAYDLGHRHSITADALKMMRVFLNICGNAVQAMNGKGNLKFRTQEKEVGGKLFVEFSILNTGSVIPEEDLAHLFEAFFTKNKKGGTGLGLAIAQKVVQSHGGSIFCRSKKNEDYPAGCVDFVFTIPAGEPCGAPQNETLPKHSSELRSKLIRLSSQAGHDATHSVGFLELEQKVLGGLKKLNRKIDLLMVDDEQVYKNAIRLHCERNPDLAELISIVYASGSSEITSGEIDGAILDVDLGEGSLDGFEIAEELRKRFEKSFICVHSNRTFADDFKRSLDSGADAFLPKPMSYEHFLSFLAQVQCRIGILDSQKSGVYSSDLMAINPYDPVDPEVKMPPKMEKNVVAIVDDSRLVRASWGLKLREVTLKPFESPEAFFAWLESPEGQGPSLKAVVTDFHFDDKSSLSGYEFAQRASQMIDAPILLSSDGEFSREILSAFSGKIPKRALSLSELDLELIKSTKG